MDPLFIGEEIAETTEAIGHLGSIVLVSSVEKVLPGGGSRSKQTYRFVWAHVLCRVRIFYSPVVPLNHAAEAGSCCEKVSFRPKLMGLDQKKVVPFCR